jgi:predicted N-acyltransferase
LDVNHSTSIGDIARNSWDALASETPLADYDWLLTCEATEHLHRKVAYWWIRDEQGLVAAVAAYLATVAAPVRSIDHHRYGHLVHVVRPIRQLLHSRPTLMCGAQMAPGNPILTRKGLSAEDYGTAVNRILDAIESHCRINQWNLLFYAMTETDRTLRNLFVNRPYLNASNLPNTLLDIRWNSWQDYLNHLKVTHPATEKSIRMQVNRGRRDGVTIEELDDPTEFESEFYRILSEHFYRKNQSHISIEPEFLTAVKKNLGDRSLIYVAKKNNRVIGVSTYIRNLTTMHWKFFGIATEFVRSSNSVYFNLAFHHPIEQACRAGCERVILGTLPYRVKLSRGARLVPTSSWIWQPNRLLASLHRVPLSYVAWRQNRYLKQFADQNQVITESMPSLKNDPGG